MDRKLTYVNPAFEILTGIPLEEMYAHNFVLWIHPEDQEKMLPLWERLFRGEGFYEYRYRLITRKGEEKWSSATWAPIYDEVGRQVGVQGRERDITEEIKAEEARRQSEERFRISFAQAAVGVILVEPAGRFLEANTAFCQIAGYSEDELKQLNYRDITHPEDLPECNRLMQQMLEGATAGFVIEKRYVRKDGQTIWAKNSVSLVRDSDGKPRSIIGLLEETSERRRAEGGFKRKRGAFPYRIRKRPSRDDDPGPRFPAV